MRSHQFTYHSTQDPDFKKASEEHPEIKEFKLTKETSFYTLDGEVGYRGNVLGSGCYGTVSVLHTQGSADYVVKRIHYGIAADEKKALTEIQHEAEINQIVYGIGELDIKKEKKIAYLFLKKLPLSLQSLYCSGNRYYQFRSLHEFLGLYINILVAVHILHIRHGIVHGDLNTGNICVSDDDVFCCDFGLSRKLFIDSKKSEQELTSGLRGSKSWHLAPELKNKILPDPSQDVYSLGKLFKFFKHCLREVYLDSFEIQYINEVYALMTEKDPKARLTLTEAIECFSELYQYIKPADPFYYSSPSDNEEKTEDKEWDEKSEIKEPINILPIYSLPESSDRKLLAIEMPEIKNPAKKEDNDLQSDTTDRKTISIEMTEVKDPEKKLGMWAKRKGLTIKTSEIKNSANNCVMSLRPFASGHNFLGYDLSETDSDLVDFVTPKSAPSEQKTILQWFYHLSSKEKIVLGIGVFLLAVGSVIATCGVALPILLGIGSICAGLGFAAVSTFATSRPEFQGWYNRQSRIKKIGIIVGVGLVVAGSLALMSSFAIVAFMGVGIGKALATIFTGHIITAKTISAPASVATGISVGTRAAIDLTVGMAVIKAGHQLSTTARLQQQGLVGKTEREEKKELPRLQRSQSMVDVTSIVQKKNISSHEPVSRPVFLHR